MLRKIMAVLGGIIVAMAVKSLCEWGFNTLYPAPTAADFDNGHVLGRLVSQMPRGTYFLLLVGYAVAAFMGGLTATLIGGRKDIIFAVITGVVIMVYGIFNLFQIPSPIWFLIVSLLVYIPFAILGYLAGMKRT